VPASAVDRNAPRRRLPNADAAVGRSISHPNCEHHAETLPITWIMTHPDHLDPRDAVKLRELRSRDRDFNRLVKHVRAFATHPCRPVPT
jgi:hypothetical protein